jgi:hypothetical protein
MASRAAQKAADLLVHRDHGFAIVAVEEIEGKDGADKGVAVGIGNPWVGFRRQLEIHIPVAPLQVRRRAEPEMYGFCGRDTGRRVFGVSGR